MSGVRPGLVRMWVALLAGTLHSTVDFYSSSQSSQSISIYDREIGAKISVSVSISRFLRLDNVLYYALTFSPHVHDQEGRGRESHPPEARSYNCLQSAVRHP